MKYPGCIYNVLGLGISGKSIAKYLLTQGAQVFGFDCRIAELTQEADIQELISLGLQVFDDKIDLIPATSQSFLLSPGIPSTHFLCEAARRKNIEVIGEIEFSCRELNQPVIGVTGTNGKTTATAQIAHTLQTFGISAYPLGNIGVPLSTYLSRSLENAVIVLELSSFQLETLNRQILDVAVFLNLTPDHLDRYSSLQEYGEAKARIGASLKKGQPLYVSQQVYMEFSDLFKEAVYPVVVFDKPSQVTHLASLSFHDRQNLAAVSAVCRHWGITTQQVLEAAASFKKDAHRLEYVTTVDQVAFYDDSKGTNVDAVLKAVEALSGKIVLIAGGLAKGAHFHCWSHAFKDKVIAICAMGTAAFQLEEELGHILPVTRHASLEEAVQVAFELAQKKACVLLSPGCASTDMFRDYKHRGELFKKYVQQLKSAFNKSCQVKELLHGSS